MQPINFYLEKLDLQNASVQRIEHQDALINAVYRVTPARGATCILKVFPSVQDCARESHVLAAYAADLPIPQLIDRVEPEDGIAGAVLMELCEGELLTCCPCTEQLAIDLGTALGQIHRIRCEGYGDLAQAATLLNSATSYFSPKFEEELEECRLVLPAEQVTQIEAYYQEHCALLEQVDGACLIHRDFRPGNVLVNKGRLAAIIDWSTARGGFAEQDFSFVEQPCLSANPRYKEAFLEAYAAVRPVPAYTELLPLIQLGRALAVIGFTLRSGSWQGRDAKLYASKRHWLDAFLDELKA